MWGSDYPHDEGTCPYTREHLRARFHDVPERELREILAGNAAQLYDFDLDALAPLADKVGPTVDEVAQPIDEVPDKTLERLSARHGPEGHQVSDELGTSSSSTTPRRTSGASPSTAPRSATR